LLGLLRIQLGFVNRLYALARFFVTFFVALCAPFPCPPRGEAEIFRSPFLAPRFEPPEGFFPAFPGALAPFLALERLRRADFGGFRELGLRALAERRVPAACRCVDFSGVLLPGATIAASTRLISRVTSSIGIIPSTLTSLRWSE
jgi:hypothetical protein